MDAIKAICEQEGVPMVSRGLYADPVPWPPMGGVSMGGNHPLALTDAQMGDSGNRRRLCYLRMRATLAESGKDVKKVINAGKLNPELFWIAKKLSEILFTNINFPMYSQVTLLMEKPLLSLLKMIFKVRKASYKNSRYHQD
jgi:hypothetical protein